MQAYLITRVQVTSHSAVADAQDAQADARMAEQAAAKSRKTFDDRKEATDGQVAELGGQVRAGRFKIDFS